MRQNALSLQTVARVLAWLVLLGLAAATLVPIELRPHSGLSTQAERLFAFGLAGLCLALAYPRRPIFVALIIVGTVLGLEAAQFLVVGRHPGLRDLVVKLAGGTGGLFVGWVLRGVVLALRRT